MNVNAMTTEQAVIRRAHKADLAGLCAVNEAIYDYRWPDAFYRWQHFENVHPNLSLVAVEGDEVVGGINLQMRELSSGNTAGQITHINVHPGHQGKGLFTRLCNEAIEAAGDRIDLVCIFANENAKGACEHVLGMEFSAVHHAYTLKVGLDCDVEYRVEKISADTEFASADQGSIGFVHSPAFMQWRFVQNPVYEYWKVTVGCGMAVVKIFEDAAKGMCFGDVVDFACDSPEPGAMRDVFAAAAMELLKRNAQSVMTWANEKRPEAKVLEGLGFEKGAKVNFGIQRLSEDAGELADFEKWELKMSDATNY